MSQHQSALIIGAGAIGSFYGAILHRAGWQVSVVVRSNEDVIKQQGYQFESVLGDISWQPHAVYTDPSQAKDISFDYVLLCTKVLPHIDRAALLEPWLSINTTIVMIQNGINIEPEVTTAFPKHAFVSCIAFIAVTRVAPGEIAHKAFGNLKLGSFPSGTSKQAEVLAEAFVKGGIKAQLVDDIVRERWIKCIWNTAFNPTSILVGGADTLQMLEAPGGESFIRTLMQEVVAVAKAHGHELSNEAIEKNISSTLKMPAYRNSMAVDYLAGRDTETDAILGNVVTIAEEHGVAVPHLQTLWSLVQIRATAPRV